MLPGDGPVDEKECWEITPCEQCPDKMTPACQKIYVFGETTIETEGNVDCFNHKEVSDERNDSKR